ncbi:GNAT family N-acetyltransferase [Thermocrispum municipale]|jgi:GNAT superfamily N-acetyltransferase|uniref:GNAT family N-acetyltransferase n=1 Tax=Thermocrispum municipale TaxID=37926 RepID=UPI000402DC63|nr:GNAT family N-acetyltransferase [Thermocrispum municipale]
MAVADVRLARAADAAEIARIQHITWQTAFSELIDEESLAALIGPEAERQWTEAIEYADTDVFIASEGDFTVGFCVSGPAPREEIEGPDGTLPPDAEHTGLIGTILVEPRWGRRGHGGRLLAAAARALRSRGARRAVAWVNESDSATLNFYRTVGWEATRTVRTLDTGKRQFRQLCVTGGLDLQLVE